MKKLAQKGGKVVFPKQLLPCTGDEIKLQLPAYFRESKRKARLNETNSVSYSSDKLTFDWSHLSQLLKHENWSPWSAVQTLTNYLILSKQPRKEGFCQRQPQREPGEQLKRLTCSPRDHPSSFCKESQLGKLLPTKTQSCKVLLPTVFQAWIHTGGDPLKATTFLGKFLPRAA